MGKVLSYHLPELLYPLKGIIMFRFYGRPGLLMDLSAEAKMGSTHSPSPHRAHTVFCCPGLRDVPFSGLTLPTMTRIFLGMLFSPFGGGSVFSPAHQPPSCARSQRARPTAPLSPPPPTPLPPRERAVPARFTATHTAVSSQGEGFLLTVSFTSQ